MPTTGHEGYIKLQAWVKQELWEELNYQGITSPTSAVTQGLQLLLDTTKNTPKNSRDTTAHEATVEGMQLLLREKEERIFDLKREVERLDHYAQFFKSLEHRRLEPRTEEVKPDIQEPITKPASSPGVEQAPSHKEKELIKKSCKFCGEEFETTNPKKETCSDKCRTAFNRRKNN
jgi:hypothetical protein